MWMVNMYSNKNRFLKTTLLIAGLTFLAISAQPFLLTYKRSFRSVLNMNINQLTISITNNEAKFSLEYAIIGQGNRNLFQDEASLLLCLPPQAALTGMHIKMGKTWVKAQLIDRKVASHSYREIVREERAKKVAQDPGIIEFVGNGIYRIRMFPVGKVTVPAKISWVQPLKKVKPHLLQLEYANKILKLFGHNFPKFKIDIHSNFPLSKKSLRYFENKTIKIKNNHNYSYKISSTKYPNQGIYFLAKNININPKISSILNQKKKMEKLWQRYCANSRMSWKKLVQLSRTMNFVSQTSSLIALETGMKLRKPKDKSAKNITLITSAPSPNKTDNKNNTFPTGNTSWGMSNDGFGGRNSLVEVKGGPQNYPFSLQKKDSSQFNKLKPNRKRLIEKKINHFKILLESRKKNLILQFLDRYKLIDCTRNWLPKRKAQQIDAILNFFQELDLLYYGITPWQLLNWVNKIASSSN